MKPALGLDFGTTNSALAFVGPGGRAELVQFTTQRGERPIWRSVLFFERPEEDRGPVRCSAGPSAIERHLSAEEKSGRLVQSLKSFLASRLFQATEIFGAMDIRTSFEFLGPAPDGQVRTGIVLGVLKGSLVSETDAEEADAQLSLDMSIYAGELEDPDRVIRIPGGFGPSRENYVASLSRRLLYRTEISLEPGRYLAVYRILDRTTGQAAQARESFTVPDRFADGDLQLSTIVLASRLAPVNTAVERPDAFTLGLFRVVPNLDATYRNGETLAFYYQVSGAALDPRTGRRRLDAEYSFAVRQGESWLELGEGLIYRDQTQPQAWSAPLQDWPPASYRLTVKITDVVRGATTSNVTFFRVVPGS